MAKKKVEQDVRDDPRYHDTRKLLRKYRDVTWSLELSVQKLKNQFHVEYGTDIDEFLDSVYLAGADLGGTELACLPSSSATQRRSLSSFSRTFGISACQRIIVGRKKRLRC